MSFSEYPYTNFHELNLDWIIKQVKELTGTVDDFVAYNKLTFRGTWTGTAYPIWSIVDDGAGNGYLAIQDVPAGVALSDTTYWTQVASYNTIYSAFNSRISALESQMTSVQTDVNTANFYIAPTDVALSGTSTLIPTTNKMTVWRHGHTVTMFLDCCMAATGTTDVAMLPANFRPPVSLTQVIPTYAGVGSDYQYIIVNPGGSVRIYCDVVPSRLLLTMSWAV